MLWFEEKTADFASKMTITWNADFYYETFLAQCFRSLTNSYWPVYSSVMFSHPSVGVVCGAFCWTELFTPSSRSLSLQNGSRIFIRRVIYCFLFNYKHIWRWSFCKSNVSINGGQQGVTSARNGVGFCEGRNLCLHFTITISFCYFIK